MRNTNGLIECQILIYYKDSELEFAEEKTLWVDYIFDIQTLSDVRADHEDEANCFMSLIGGSGSFSVDIPYQELKDVWIEHTTPSDFD